MKRFQNIVACTDFSDQGNRAIEMAFGLCNGSDSTVTLVHVLDAMPMANPMYAHYYPTTDWTPEVMAQAREAALKGLEELVPNAAKESKVNVRFEVPQGRHAGEILEVAHSQNADVLVIGTHGYRGVKRFLLGSVAEEIVRTSTCPVMVVH